MPDSVGKRRAIGAEKFVVNSFALILGFVRIKSVPDEILNLKNIVSRNRQLLQNERLEDLRIIECYPQARVVAAIFVVRRREILNQHITVLRFRQTFEIRPHYLAEPLGVGWRTDDHPTRRLVSGGAKIAIDDLPERHEA